jgi:uncharacterized protein YycO
MAGQDLSTRKGQVPSERLKPIGEYDYQPVIITLQEHRADRRGLHYDLRIMLPDRAISFVIPWGSLDKDPGERGHWIRQPDHGPEYAFWEGTIPQGEYGAGQVKVVGAYPGTLTTKPDGGLDLSYGVGDKQRRVTLAKPYDKNNYYAVMRHMPEQRHWQERPPYKDLPASKPIEGLWASEKLDGALVYAVLGEKGITLTSRRLSSKNGQQLAREHHVPWIRDIRVPKEYQGMVLAGELKHPMGFSFTGPLMNSKPERAVEIQGQLGKMVFHPHNILNKEMTYPEKMALLERMSNEVGSPYMKTPRYSPDPASLMQQVKDEGGEGVILVDPTGQDNTMYKKKFVDTYTGEIVDIIPSSKRPGTAAAMLVRDDAGNTVNVGGGKDLTVDLRYDMWKNRNKYKGRRVRVNAHGSTGQSLRQPQFGGFAMDDDPLDSFESLTPVYGQIMPKTASRGSDLDRFVKQAMITFDESRGTVPVRFTDFVTQLQPGDILLSKANSKAGGPKGYRMLRDFLNARTRWGHVAIYAGDNKVVHMYGDIYPGHPNFVSGYIREHDISSFARERNDLIALRPQTDEQTKLQAVERARAMKGIGYSYWDLLRTGLWPGKTDKDPRKGMICSAVAAYAYPSIAWRGQYGKQYTRPADIFKSENVQPVASYSSER